MPQVSHLFGVYAASPMLDPASPLRISVAWTCVAGVLAAAHLFNTPEGTGLSAWIALWFTYGLAGRSEEHTSELQSLMRISSAVFCLKHKKYNHVQITLYVHLETN